MVESFDEVVEKVMATHGSIALLKQMPQLGETLKRAQQQASTSQHAAQNCKVKAMVVGEILGNISRRI